MKTKIFLFNVLYKLAHSKERFKYKKIKHLEAQKQVYEFYDNVSIYENFITNKQISQKDYLHYTNKLALLGFDLMIIGSRNSALFLGLMIITAIIIDNSQFEQYRDYILAFFVVIMMTLIMPLVTIGGHWASKFMSLRKDEIENKNDNDSAKVLNGNFTLGDILIPFSISILIGLTFALAILFST